MTKFKNLRNSKLLTSALFILFGGFLFFSNDIEIYKEKRVSISSYSSKAQGLSVFLEYAKRVWPEKKITIKKKMLVKADDLYQSDPKQSVFLLLAPRKPLSKREVKVLREFVYMGGTIITSFHNRQSESIVDDLNPQDFQKNASFKNKKLTKINLQKESINTEKGDEVIKAAFYSKFFFTNGDKDCHRHLDCWMKFRKFGKGQFISLNGLPFFSNVLIDKEENLKLAHILFAPYSEVVIDEYSHFYSDFGFLKLLELPFFTISIGTLILILILSFRYGDHHLDDLKITYNLKGKSASFHEDTVAILSFKPKRREVLMSAMVRYRQDLVREFPDLRPELHKIEIPWGHDLKEFEKIAEELVKKHKKALYKRGLYNGSI